MDLKSDIASINKASLCIICCFAIQRMVSKVKRPRLPLQEQRHQLFFRLWRLDPLSDLVGGQSQDASVGGGGTGGREGLEKGVQLVV